MKTNQESRTMQSATGAALTGLALVTVFSLPMPPALAQSGPISGDIGTITEVCESAGNGEPVLELAAGNDSAPIRIYWTESGLEDKLVAAIVNGNGYNLSSYETLARDLAMQGFVAAVLRRPGGGSSGTGETVLDSLQAALDALEIDREDPELLVALIGHSVGGGLVVDAAVANQTGDRGFPVRAVVGLAPVSGDTAHLRGIHTGGYLVIYGSQDEDVDGFGTPVREAFRAYDEAGNEGTTACNFPPCIGAAPPLDKTMLYIHGADHAGLIGLGFGGIFLPQELDYVAPADQLCIVETYVVGFLNWRLRGLAASKDLVRGLWPKSVENITTAEEDGFGNPAGADLRMFLQISPASRRVLQNFEASLGQVDTAGSVATQHLLPGEFSQAPRFVRHNTGAALIGWEADAGVKYVRWPVPERNQVSSTYTHFAIRLGQLEQAPAPYANPLNEDQEVTIAFQDVSGLMSFHDIDGLPAPDRYTAEGADRARSAMQTVRIPVSEIDVSYPDQITHIYLYLSSPTSGTLLVDSLEWQRD